MKVKVSDNGVIVPKTYFEGVDEVEIRKENGLILLVPISDGDPIFKLGEAPVTCGVSDASENHDKYLYG